MTKLLPRFLLFFTLLFGSATHCLAQITQNDSLSQQVAKSKAIHSFYTALGNVSPVYNGIAYDDPAPVNTGTAFFLDTVNFKSGSVDYDGSSLTEVPLLYDLVSDHLVSRLFDNFSRYFLLREKVKSFDLLSHHFINIASDSLEDKTELAPGYYDQLYKGKIQILAKRSKSKQISTGGNGYEIYYRYVVDYYLKKDKGYYKFNSQGSLLDLLKDKKKPLNTFIRAEKIKFRNDRERSMVQIASYYDSLSN